MRLSDLNTGDKFTVVGDLKTYMLTSLRLEASGPQARQVVIVDGGQEGLVCSMNLSRPVIPVFSAEHFQVIKLERHEYAPELNKLHCIKDGKEVQLPVPRQTTIEDAISYLGES